MKLLIKKSMTNQILNIFYVLVNDHSSELNTLYDALTVAVSQLEHALRSVDPQLLVNTYHTIFHGALNAQAFGFIDLFSGTDVQSFSHFMLNWSFLEPSIVNSPSIPRC